MLPATWCPCSLLSHTVSMLSLRVSTRERAVFTKLNMKVIKRIVSGRSTTTLEHPETQQEISMLGWMLTKILGNSHTHGKCDVHQLSYLSLDRPNCIMHSIDSHILPGVIWCVNDLQRTVVSYEYTFTPETRYVESSVKVGPTSWCPIDADMTVHLFNFQSHHIITPCTFTAMNI